MCGRCSPKRVLGARGRALVAARGWFPWRFPTAAGPKAVIKHRQIQHHHGTAAGGSSGPASVPLPVCSLQWEVSCCCCACAACTAPAGHTRSPCVPRQGRDHVPRQDRDDVALPQAEQGSVPPCPQEAQGPMFPCSQTGIMSHMPQAGQGSVSCPQEGQGSISLLPLGRARMHVPIPLGKISMSPGTPGHAETCGRAVRTQKSSSLQGPLLAQSPQPPMSPSSPPGAPSLPGDPLCDTQGVQVPGEQCCHFGHGWK